MEANLEKILNEASNKNCSDIHLTVNSPVIIRLDGDLVTLPNYPTLNEQMINDMLYSIMSPAQKEFYLKNKEIDFSTELQGKVRFRVNAFYTMRGPASVFRIIPGKVKPIAALNVPTVIQDLAKINKGMILVVGPTGSGKSTTLASMIDYLNINYNKHIITIEDPIEFIHQNKKSLVNQREVGGSTLSFSNALKSALREDPDVILVGEMRDLETIHLALTAAETGHLVFGTLHTISASQTINRIIDVFPANEKPTIRSMLSEAIAAVISQRLIKKTGGGRCAAFEIMIANSSIRNLIREDKIPQINSMIALNRKLGMVSMKDSVKELHDRGFISKESMEEELISFE